MYQVNAARLLGSQAREPEFGEPRSILLGKLRISEPSPGVLLTSWNNVRVHLTPGEAAMIALLVINAGRSVSYHDLCDILRVQGEIIRPADGGHAFSGRIYRLRGKFRALDRTFNCIRTTWHVGFRWESMA